MTPEDSAAMDAAIWATAMRLGTFSYASLAAEAHTTIERATKLVKDWRQADAVVPAGQGDRGRLLFRLQTADMPVPKAPRTPPVGTPQGNMWRAMQMLASFSPTDVAAHSHVPEAGVAVSHEDATAYCQALCRADYLRVVRKAIPGKREAIYRLIRNTGPRPPVMRRIRALIDQNEGRIVHVAGGFL
jgi:hypothetical protein